MQCKRGHRPQRIDQLVAMADFPVPLDSRSSISKRQQQPAAEEWVVGVRLLDHWPCADALRTEAIGTSRTARPKHRESAIKVRAVPGVGIGYGRGTSASISAWNIAVA